MNSYKVNIKGAATYSESKTVFPSERSSKNASGCSCLQTNCSIDLMGCSSSLQLLTNICLFLLICIHSYFCFLYDSFLSTNWLLQANLRCFCYWQSRSFAQTNLPFSLYCCGTIPWEAECIVQKRKTKFLLLWHGQWEKTLLQRDCYWKFCEILMHAGGCASE